MTMYDYKELLAKAKETGNFEDLENLASWFFNYGADFWNGESWELEEGERLFPIYSEEEDENGGFPIVAYEIR